MRSNIPRPDHRIGYFTTPDGTEIPVYVDKIWYNWFSIFANEDVVNIQIQSQLALLNPKANVDETNRKLGELRSIVVMAERNYQAQIDALKREVTDLKALIYGRH